MPTLRGFLPVLVLLVACGIPAYEHPAFVTAHEAGYLDDDDLVLGYVDGEVPRAYPIRALAPLEILNDTVGGRPVAVTWCPLSGTAAVFDRVAGDDTLTFRFHPDLHHMNLIIEDLDTKSQWSQIAARAIEGNREGTPLTLLPSVQTTWGRWRAEHPGTLVMTDAWGEHDFEYRDAGELVEGIPERALVLAVQGPRTTRLYPYPVLAEAPAPLEDRIDGRPVRVHYRGEGPTAWATDDRGELLPALTLYWVYRSDFFPEADVFMGHPDG